MKMVTNTGIIKPPNFSLPTRGTIENKVTDLISIMLILLTICKLSELKEF